MFYGPGRPLAMFTGRDASGASALLPFDPIDLTGSIEGLSESELEVLPGWEYNKFMEKYVRVGQLVPEGTRAHVEDRVQENKNQEQAAEAK